MKILFIQKIKAFAGSEKYLTELIPALMKKGYECKLVFVTNPKDRIKLSHFFEVLEDKNIPYNCIETQRDLSFNLLRKLYKTSKESNYDLIHLNLIHAELWFSLIKSIFRMKTDLISTIHGFDESFQANYGFDPSKITKTRYVRILKFCQKRIKGYFAVSNGLKNLVVKSHIIPENKIRTINYGFDYPEYNGVKKENTDSIKNILVPGRIVPYKGQDMVISIIPELIAQGYKIKVSYAGDFQGPFGDLLKQKVEALEISDYVNFLGHVSNLEAHYSAADVVILPSKSEGFGLVLLEAFNFEVPVITFDVPAFNETIQHEITGLITPAFNLDELMLNVKRIFEDPILSTNLTTAAKSRLLNYYSLDRMVNETITFYDEMSN